MKQRIECNLNKWWKELHNGCQLSALKEGMDDGDDDNGGGDDKK